MSRRDALRQLLEGFAPADPTELAHRGAMLALLDSEGDPFSRSHFGPGHFTASTFILSPDHSALLLIYHRKLQRWLQPGGHIDPGDSDVFRAALREAEEETGARGLRFACPDSRRATDQPSILDVDVHEIPARKTEPGHRHFDIRTLLVASDRALDPQLAEVAGARWAPLGTITAHMTDESVMRAARKLMG